MNCGLVDRPPWLVQRVKANSNAERVNHLTGSLALNTVCLSAHCPNLGECFGSGTATFLILGGTCTRSCKFCAVPKGLPVPLDATEPERLGRAVAALKLKHVVITSVTRDDLALGGAEQFVECIRQIRVKSPGTTIEVLTPDFKGRPEALELIFDARPEVFNHNMETVPRLYSMVRPEADYARSLAILHRAAATGQMIVKSGMMVGLGETRDELITVMEDLVKIGVSNLTIGQYLRPSDKHLPVVEYVKPGVFESLELLAYSFGFTRVRAGPLVRSSYLASASV